MPNAAVRILIVGQPSPHTSAVLARLAQKGYESIDVANVSDAAEVLGTFHFDVVLAPEILPDGSGYQLAPEVAAQWGSLVVAVQLSETCLWLPVIVAGSKVLGERALNMSTLEWDLERILTIRNVEHSRAVSKYKSMQAAGSRKPHCAAVLSRTGLPPHAIHDPLEDISSIVPPK